MKGKYDLCVLDVMMPKKDGFTLAQEIRTVNSEVPVIFLTAKSLKEDILEGFKIGADDYITKPFSMEELVFRIEAILRRVKGKKGKEDQKSYMEVVYLDANLPDSDGTYGELAADPNKKNRAESEVFAEESRNIFGIYLQKYCQAMTNAKAEPPRALALYYARILPHVLYIMYGIETIPDSKGASAAWAFEHMQEKTMEILGEQSEEEMQEWLYDSLRWSENFWNQMDLEIYVNSERKLLKDVVYTEVYDQRRIDDWSESMHKTVTELAHREIKKDKRLANWAVDHIVESDKTYNLFKGGRKK